VPGVPDDHTDKSTNPKRGGGAANIVLLALLLPFLVALIVYLVIVSTIKGG
jgi:hypothetical protein